LFDHGLNAASAERLQSAYRRHNTALLIWTIYERPRDYPALYIARPHVVERGHTGPLPFHLQAPTLDLLRSQLPFGLAMLARADGDDPCIVETWL
jgi:hypothetical protein